MDSLWLRLHMELSMSSRSCIGGKMPKKKKELPVFVVVDMPEWKTKILDSVLWLLRIPGKAWVIGVEETGFTYDGDYYTDTTTRTKISRKVIANEKA
jgi:hypothetical protein